MELVRNGGKDMTCCGKKMERIDKNRNIGDPEKHTPRITREGSTVTVSLAEGGHPMTDEHYIGWIALSTNRGVQRRAFMPSETPRVDFPIGKDESPREAIAFCNLHGMWYKDVEPEY